MDAFITEKSKDYSLLDNQTGEIIEYRQTRKVKMEDFVMVFLASCREMFALRGTQFKVLACCWIYSSFNNKSCNQGNLFRNDGVFKDSCRREGLNLSDAAIDNVICQLAKKKFLLKQCRGTYLLNPQYFFKGTLAERSKVMYTLMVEPEVKERQQTITELNRMFSQQA